MNKPVTNSDLENLETRLLDRPERAETTLLKAFRKRAESLESREIRDSDA